MYLTMCKNFGIDMFRLLAPTSLKSMQTQIISSLNKIIKIIKTKYIGDDIMFCIVSNADSEWLKDAFCSKKPQFKKLGILHIVHIVHTIHIIHK